jgi:hypothetical protein
VAARLLHAWPALRRVYGLTKAEAMTLSYAEIQAYLDDLEGG